jgi:hypothetical protein
MHRAGIHNSNDVVDVLATGLRAFARMHGISSAAVFSQAWPEALSVLKNSRSEEDWMCLLPQEASAFKRGPVRLAKRVCKCFGYLRPQWRPCRWRPTGAAPKPRMSFLWEGGGKP